MDIAFLLRRRRVQVTGFLSYTYIDTYRDIIQVKKPQYFNNTLSRSIVPYNIPSLLLHNCNHVIYTAYSQA